MLNPVVSVNRGLQVSGDGTNKAQNRAAAQRHAGKQSGGTQGCGGDHTWPTVTRW